MRTKSYKSFNLSKNQFNKLKNFFEVVLYKKIPCNECPIAIYQKIRDNKSVLVHSPIPGKNSRYSIIAANPELFFSSKNNVIIVDDGNKIMKKIGNPLMELKKIIEGKESNDALPFNGGLIGFLGYDMVHFIEKLPRKAIDDLNLPHCCFGLYNEYILHDNQKNIIYIVSVGKDYEKCVKKIQSLEKKLKNTIPRRKSIKKIKKIIFQSNFTKQQYVQAIKKIKGYIFAGDTFQVNLSQRFWTEILSDPLEVYKHLIEINPSPFSAYLDFPQLKLLSSSPERLVLMRDRKVETMPIAGTRKRGKTKKEDLMMEKELKNNKKELAEHTMLVDLERNDLGKVCEYGTVDVEERFTIEKYSHVMHLVSKISGKLRKNLDFIDVIKAVFPGGTITGCPKIRTMEIIDELEPTARGPYTGSIGYIDFAGNMDLNIIIRTIVINGNKAYLQAGGGIVADSTLEFEYQETINKAKALFEALRSK